MTFMMFIRLLNIWITLMAIWLILNSPFTWDKMGEVVPVGAVLSLVAALMFLRLGDAYADVRFTGRRIGHYFLYLGVFLRELAIANINVMRLVFARQIVINPGIVEIKTELKSPIGRLALANSITLTPGTLTVDIRGDSLFIHWINVASEDPEGATKAIAATFEKYLKVIYG